MKIANVVIKLVGVTFNNENGMSRQGILANLSKGNEVTLKREPQNPHDKNAIAVLSSLGQIGYIGRDYAQILSNMIDNEDRLFTAKIHEVDTYKGTRYASILINEV